MTPAQPPAQRLAFLDLTKGVLVLLMIAYHGLNYTDQYRLGFRYFSFLPPSFILITGFLLSKVYAPRYEHGDPTLRSRLLLRGAKLIGLFTALNILAQFVRSPAYGRSVGVMGFWEQWQQVFFWGSGRIAVFEILLPIAYLLLIAPGLLWASHRHPRFLPLFTVVIVGTSVGLDYGGVDFANLKMISAGVLGMLAGRVISEPAMVGRYRWVALAAFGAYLPLGTARGYFFLIQLLGSCVALVLIAGLSVRWGERGWLQKRIVRIGQYSLVAYIAQIAILQTLSRFLGRPHPLDPEALLLFAGTPLLMALAVEIGHGWRQHSTRVDKIYRALFA